MKSILKIVQVGASGHFDLMLKVLKKRTDVVFTGFATGTEEEAGDAFIRACGSDYNFTIYEDYIKMFDELKPDIAVINSHYYLNSRITGEALKRGINCFTEKPVATSLDELELLRKQYVQTPANFAAMLALRCNPAFKAAYDHIRTGKIGEPLLITTQKSYKLGQRNEFYKHRKKYGGTIPWVGIHSIDWIRWLSGKELTSVYASHNRLYNNCLNELETIAVCQFQMENGGIASTNIDYLRPLTAATHGDDRARVVGSNGVIEVRSERAFVIDSSGEYELPLPVTPNIFESFIEQVLNKGVCAVSAEDSFRSTEIALKAQQSADEGRLIML